jgi:hypothetical protein
MSTLRLTPFLSVIVTVKPCRPALTRSAPAVAVVDALAALLALVVAVWTSTFRICHSPCTPVAVSVPNQEFQTDWIAAKRPCR